MNSEQLKRFAYVETELRKHVVATMPIRLILVNPTGRTTQLKLIDRNGIVERIIDAMKQEGDYGDVKTMIAKAKSKARFGILSHTWEKGELKYQDLTEPHPDAKILQAPGYVKLQDFCWVLPQGMEYAWADTVCIDKSSSAELDESIRSMFKWYRFAAICIAYLAQTTSIANIGDDKWFTRGWTLQELLAPRKLKYYGKNWEALTTSENDKKRDSSNEKVYDAVAETTEIPDHEIAEFTSQAQYDVSRRMTWMASRETTREEDMAYALMGLFGVSMSPAYGEGSQRAFLRLFKELLSISSSLDLFNWASHPVADDIHRSRMLPSSPECFLSHAPNDAGDFNPYEDGATEPPLLTSVGLRMKVLLLPVDMTVDSDSSDSGDEGYIVYLKPRLPIASYLPKAIPTCLLIDEDTFDELTAPETEVALGLINFSNEDRPIPPDCLAVVLCKEWQSSWKKLPTKHVVWFNEDDKYRASRGSDRTLGMLTVDELKSRGFARGFETLYL